MCGRSVDTGIGGMSLPGKESIMVKTHQPSPPAFHAEVVAVPVRMFARAHTVAHAWTDGASPRREMAANPASIC